MIEVCHLTKHYGSLAAVQDINFQVAQGEILGFLGPNGAGKTTTMRILAGCLAPSDGTARIAGYDILEQSLEARRALGYLPEQVPLYPEMRVEEYLRFVGALRGMSAREVSQRLSEALSRCGLTEVRSRLIGRLSRGYRQRVGLAQALLPNPRVLILDEPTVGLDPRQIIEVRELIRGLAGDHTVLLSTHILPEVSMVCTRVVIIDHGHVVAEDTPERLTGATHGGERLLLEVEGPPDSIARLVRAVPGVMSVVVQDSPASARSAEDAARFVVQSAPGEAASARNIRREIARALVKAGYGLLELRAEDVTLEDVFVRLTTTEAV
jgi:ABC-2 type transport system ATP-binding protein